MPGGFFFVVGGFRSFFRVVPISSYGNPKTPGVVMIKAPVTALKRKCMTPGPSIWPFLAFSANCGSRAVPFTGIW